MIVTMAMLTTMAMPPMLRAALTGLPMSKEEETRVERETMDERGFRAQAGTACCWRWMQARSAAWRRGWRA